jgi:hypothetical protein
MDNPASTTYKLVRESDGLTKQSDKVGWVEWNEDDSANTIHDSIAVGRSCILGPFSAGYRWLTTTVTEIIEQSEAHVKFRTKNSVYELFITK